jgi:15-cis-phytoene synthase
MRRAAGEGARVAAVDDGIIPFGHGLGHIPAGQTALSDHARTALGELYAHLRRSGCAAPADVVGQAIRPLLSLAGCRALGVAEDESFWAAAGAVQLAHEASLVHDDVIDGASIRRSRPTLAASRGVAVALVEGDHLLTTSYRLAATTGSPGFVRYFAWAVERTVAGEKLQGRSAGTILDEREYRHIVAMKSGELLGCALAAAPLVAGDPRAADFYALGRRIGTLYQMLDDLLDYCPDGDTGKTPLADYRQGRWTWPLGELPGLEFGRDAAEVARCFASPDAPAGSPTSPLQRCLHRFRHEARSICAAIAVHMPRDTVVTGLVAAWEDRAAEVVREAEAAEVRRSLLASLADRAARADDLHAFFRHHSRSFSFAAGFFPRSFRHSIAGLYAFCRVTDDIADEPADGTEDFDGRPARLELWLELARTAYETGHAGIAILDSVMPAAARAGVPFRYVEELVEGMRMDLRVDRPATHHDLRTYSYRVAGVVGQWITRMCGVHDDGVLERAAALGHAMQLTNILRDVGEDLARGRVYLPAAALARYGVTEADLRAAVAGSRLPDGYARLMEDLMARADEDYAQALAATPALPWRLRHAVRVAAHVYRGIHGALRDAGYDNLRRRARITGSVRIRLAARALVGLPMSPHAPRRTFTHAASGNRGLSAGAARRAAGVTATVLLLGALLGGTALRGQTGPVHAAPAPADAAAPVPHRGAIDRVRELYFAAVDDAGVIDHAHAALAEARTDTPAAGPGDALLLAYDGAFIMLRAKHGTWPPARLRAVREGLERLDAAVVLAPADVEVRYLRLVNTHFLPGFFGRRDTARADLDAVTVLLPGAAETLPEALRDVIAAFVQDHAR